MPARGLFWASLAVFFLVFTVAGQAAAEESCGDRSGVRTQVGESPAPGELMSVELGATGAENQEGPTTTLRPSPCSRTREPGSYDICFIETPWPMTTMPKWIAEWQAEEAVSQVFASINLIHEQLAEQGVRRPRAPLALSPKRAWLAEVVTQMESGRLPGEPTSVCIETSDQSCQSPPAAIPSSAMAFVVPSQIEEEHEFNRGPHPTRLATDGPISGNQIGPADGYLPPPDRPPWA